jgi:hypothetical protein
MRSCLIFYCIFHDMYCSSSLPFRHPVSHILIRLVVGGCRKIILKASASRHYCNACMPEPYGWSRRTQIGQNGLGSCGAPVFQRIYEHTEPPYESRLYFPTIQRLTHMIDNPSSRKWPSEDYTRVATDTSHSWRIKLVMSWIHTFYNDAIIP